MAEAEQQVIKAEADAQASLEEAHYQTLSTAADVKTAAELEVRKNPTLAAITGPPERHRAGGRQEQTGAGRKDFMNKQATAGAGIAIQKAAVEKSQVLAGTGPEADRQHDT